MIEIPQPYYDYINLAFWLIMGYMSISTITIYTIVYLRDKLLPTANPLLCTIVFTRQIFIPLLLQYLYYQPKDRLIHKLRHNKKLRTGVGGVWYHNKNYDRWYRENEFPILVYAYSETPEKYFTFIENVLDIVEVYYESDHAVICIDYSIHEYLEEIIYPRIRENKGFVNIIDKNQSDNLKQIFQSIT